MLYFFFFPAIHKHMRGEAEEEHLLVKTEYSKQRCVTRAERGNISGLLPTRAELPQSHAATEVDFDMDLVK